ncbi:MAG: coproporphyrinogen-III oxidase family protein [Spirochaetota bacterium]
MIARAVSTLLKRSLRPFVFTPTREREEPVALPGLGVYVHIPFCRSICSFCPYYKVRYREELVPAFVDALELEIVRAGVDGRIAASSVYFGGGTPALLVAHLPRIRDAIERGFDVRGPWGIELHPDDVDEATTASLRSTGFDMVSLGMQSFNPANLRALGRAPEDLSPRIDTAVRAGFSVIDVDLIFGIPGQTPAAIAGDVRTALDHGATQVSTYPFIDFSFTPNRVRPVRGRRQRDLLDALLEATAAAGLERTSVWTFARPASGRYSSVTRDAYLGFGPSAASLLSSSFCVNVFSVDEYVRRLANDPVPACFRVDFSRRERALFWLFWRSYNLRLDRRDYESLFDEPMESRFGLELSAARALGILRREGEAYELTPRGARLFHRVEQLYTYQYIDRVWRLGTSGSRRRFTIG